MYQGFKSCSSCSPVEQRNAIRGHRRKLSSQPWNVITCLRMATFLGIDIYNGGIFQGQLRYSSLRRLESILCTSVVHKAFLTAARAIVPLQRTDSAFT